MASDANTAPPFRRRTTIRDVARESGLALSTVSNALAGKEYVRPDTRRLVEETAARLGYRASVVAQALRTRRSNTIGVLLADIANPSSPDFVRGIEDVALKEGCTLFLCNTDGSEALQREQMRSLLDRQVDGMVLISQYSEGPEVRNLLDTGAPFVLVQRRSFRHQDNFVGADNRTSILEAVRYLAGQGHRRIGFIVGPAYSSAVIDRLSAFRGVVADMQLDSAPELVVPADYGTEAGHRAANVLLTLRKPPTAIMASNDMNALGVLDVAAERGIDVPGQLSVIGYDDIALARLARINLTTIALPKREMGEAAARLLLEHILANQPVPPRAISFPTSFVIRGSTGPVATQKRNPKSI